MKKEFAIAILLFFSFFIFLMEGQSQTVTYKDDMGNIIKEKMVFKSEQSVIEHYKLIPTSLYYEDRTKGIKTPIYSKESKKGVKQVIVYIKKDGTFGYKSVPKVD